VVNISAVRDEEETAYDPFKARSSIVSLRNNFSIAIGYRDAIKELTTVDSKYILEREEWADDPIAVGFP
jgi:hypothetical protein